MRGATKRKLPDFLRPCFWDCPFSQLNWQSDRDLIIARVLAYGTLQGIRWLRKTLGDDALRAWLVCREGDCLSAQQLRFWEVILHLPHGKVTSWIEQAARQI